MRHRNRVQLGWRAPIDVITRSLARHGVSRHQHLQTEWPSDPSWTQWPLSISVLTPALLADERRDGHARECCCEAPAAHWDGGLGR